MRIDLINARPAKGGNVFRFQYPQVERRVLPKCLDLEAPANFQTETAYWRRVASLLMTFWYT
jgi:hypothetical protein